jgi:hypothetical protein
MLSSDRAESAGRRRRRKARRNATIPAAASGRAGAGEPWDTEAAEALTRLFESDEGQLHKPHVGGRASPTAPPIGPAAATTGRPGADDRAWLEAHLSDLAERLQVSLARLDPDTSLAALNSRLEAIEERFDRALERVAQRADVLGLRAIEAHVLELAGHLEKTRDRLEQIGTLEEEVRGLAQRLDAGDQQQIGTLGKLLRDYIGEWRESEQRTAGALHSLEEAVNRLGDTVDAMEASKPAPDLSFATIAVPDPARARGPGDPLAQAGAGLAAKSYHSTLDAADYAPKAVPDEPPGADAAPAQGGRRLLALPGAAIAWSAAPADASGDPEVGEAEAGAPQPRLSSRIMAVRAKLRDSRPTPEETAGAQEASPAPAAAQDAPQPLPVQRARPGLLLLAGIALLAGGAFLLVHALRAAAPPHTLPARIAPGVPPSGAEPAQAEPRPPPAGEKGAPG